MLGDDPLERLLIIKFREYPVYLLQQLLISYTHNDGIRFRNYGLGEVGQFRIAGRMLTQVEPPADAVDKRGICLPGNDSG